MGQYGGLFNICWAVLGRTRLVPGMFYGVFGVTAIRAPGRRLMFYVDCVFMAVHQHVYVHSHVGGWRGGSDVCSFVEEDDLWHPAAGSAVVVDQEVHPAAKQEPIQRIGEPQAVE